MIDTTATPSPEAVELALFIKGVMQAHEVVSMFRKTYGVDVITAPDAITLRKRGNSIVLKGAITQKALRNAWETVQRT